MSSGQIMLLNGASSAGKSTIAQALQGIMEEPFYLTGIDHFLHRLPQRLVVISDSHNPPPAETWLAIFEEERLARVEIGPRGYQLPRGMYHSITALVNTGIHVIVDDVIFDPHVFEIALNTLPSKKVFFVGIRCPIEIIEQRERERGDRALGGARFFGERVHAHGDYDLEVDSAIRTAEECAWQIKSGFERRTVPTAFQKKRDMRRAQ